MLVKKYSFKYNDKCKLALFVLLQDAAQTQFCYHFTEMLMALHLTLFTAKHNIKTKERNAVSVCPMDEHKNVHIIWGK